LYRYSQQRHPHLQKEVHFVKYQVPTRAPKREGAGRNAPGRHFAGGGTFGEKNEQLVVEGGGGGGTALFDLPQLNIQLMPFFVVCDE